MVRKDKITKMLELARQHDTLHAATGPRANPDTDAARAAYNKARAEATQEERDLFDRTFL